MRTYYASDKKKREEAKRRQQEQKRLKRLNKSATANSLTEAETEPASDAKVVKPEGSGKAENDG